MLLILSCSQTTGNSQVPIDSPSSDLEILTEGDYELLKNYADTCEIEDAAGQLFMVGLPTDIARYKQDKVIDKIINELHIGWVFINTYNYWWNEKTNPSKNDVLSDIANFYNRIQDRALESGMKIPVGFSANFEGGNYSSIGRILSQSPEALAIAASNNEEIVYKVGSLVGHQLRQLGIHILLGPVFDVDSTSAREFVTRTQNRIFAGTPDLVTNITSHYLNGLKKNGIIVIAKHFPGYGDVSENPHNNEMPESRDSLEALESNLIPYKSLESNIDGVMTAHMSINILDPSKSKIVTFSPLIVNDLYRKNEEIEILENKTLSGLSYGDKVAITDDLADMGAIRQYIKSNNFAWDDIVVQAFDAGHDILLFSVIEKDRNDSYKFSGFRDFDIARLEEILKNFINYIKSSKDNEDQFRRSLYRSLILKAKIAKLYDQSVHDFLTGIGMERWRLGAIKEDTLKSIPINESESGFEDADSIVDEALKAGYLEINKAVDWNLKNVPANLNISVFTDSSIDDNDEESIRHNFSNVTFYKLRRQKTEEQYREIYRQLVLSLESNDKIYFTVSTQDDANIIKSAYEQHRNLVRQKLVILIHNTPTLIESNILQSVTVIGCFSSLYVSYVIDFDIILGKTEVKPGKNLTISLGSNGSVYDHKKNEFSFTLENSKYILLPSYATAKEKSLTEENRRLEDSIESILLDFHNKERKNMAIIMSLCIAIIILIILLFFIKRKKSVDISSYAQSVSAANKPKDNIVKAIISVCMIILFSLITTVWYFVGKSFLLNSKEPLTISGLIFCLAYQFSLPVFAIIAVVVLIILLLINSPNSFHDFINIFKQNGENRTTR
jgi:beta-glucosidase-like glycosyl hydrolase